MEPKAAAGKKPAATEKAPTEKSPAEKKPKAEKNLPKDPPAAGADKKKTRHKKSVETCKIYIFKCYHIRLSQCDTLGYNNRFHDRNHWVITLGYHNRMFGVEVVSKQSETARDRVAFRATEAASEGATTRARVITSHARLRDE
ncbi:hypothetical protein L6452_37666 [Arctium lappa]|uniref:Uncharacterized protein n=1 Tax=Arctium lappa TaxID=4217 RepID=A0ACB8Y3K8_ARCLA|nr:hypothetical protein L6452_37666 [Arctium lappa]